VVIITSKKKTQKWVFDR